MAFPSILNVEITDDWEYGSTYKVNNKIHHSVNETDINVRVPVLPVHGDVVNSNIDRYIITIGI